MGFILVAVNLAAGAGLAFPLTRLVQGVHGRPVRASRCFAILTGTYLVECVSVAMGMGIPVLSVGLAIVWGVVLGLWLRTHSSTREALKTALLLSLYSCLPAASMILVPALMWASGWHVLSVEDGVRFGIPELLPWPLGTILGFYAALVFGAVAFKVTVTAGITGWIVRASERAGGGELKIA